MNGLHVRRSWFGALVSSAAVVALFASAGAAQPSAPAQPAKPATAHPAQPAAAQPAVKPSTTAKIGDTAPAFTLKDTEGKEHSLSEYAGKIVVLEWFNPECPVSSGFHTQSTVMVDTAKEFKDKGVVWLAVNSTGTGVEGAGVERNTKARSDWKIDYPVLLDESGVVGRAYGAKTTPHMFIIGADGKLAYKGAIVDQKDEKANYVKQALTQLVAKESVSNPETRSFGCGVHYGPEPKKSN